MTLGRQGATFGLLWGLLFSLLFTFDGGSVWDRDPRRALGRAPSTAICETCEAGSIIDFGDARRARIVERRLTAAVRSSAAPR
jgi:hypothetical protein